MMMHVVDILMPTTARNTALVYTFTGYKYAGNQNGNQCTCGDSFGKHGMAGSDGECNKPCPDGHSQTKCGGALRNSIRDTDYLGNSGRIIIVLYCKLCLNYNCHYVL